MALTALIIYLAWALLAFGLRSWTQWRRTGDAGFRGAGLARGSLQWWARILFAAALIGGLAGPVAGLAGLSPLPGADRPALQAAGTALALLGTAATLAAQTSMGTSWRVGVAENETTDLVTSGAFAFARNPIFTAMIVTAAGLTAMVPNLVSLAALVLAMVSIELQVRAVEEPYLLRVHGTAYQQYASRVGRFLPGIGRLPNRAGTS
ncbi:isoprenylcysteine carboxylmethyltransferase family protein [Nonomuraea sp. NN258]|uniref:methyltransferase family protein n=1 Tax=Nonomuraea antri TaxID=2730852 RepID=UPI00156A5344|nr:isoprenylcysteine carboxylmethyltransferase family protein [Nonomuraea antri]NRQ38869.1 isoprenylcysteine carboxylmethyltransferase family protein [Nonomuraea antri]